MFGLIKLNNIFHQSAKQIRQLSSTSTSNWLNSNGFNGSLYKPTLDKSEPFEPLKINYKCPSMKSFQLPLTNIKIDDIMKRQMLNLPEINKNKEVTDPLLKFQIEKIMPEIVNKKSPMSCNSSLMSETKWRKRKMNKHKQKKYYRKMFYVIKRRKQAKEKRYNTILTLFREIHEKKVKAFDPHRFIYRELEKAKFFGYTCDTETYAKARSEVESLPGFDQKYFKKFQNEKIPYHMRPENAKFMKTEN